MGENLEGQLVRVNGVTFPGHVHHGQQHLRLHRLRGDWCHLRAHQQQLAGEELTGCEVDMLGIVSQFSFDGFGATSCSAALWT